MTVVNRVVEIFSFRANDLDTCTSGWPGDSNKIVSHAVVQAKKRKSASENSSSSETSNTDASTASDDTGSESEEAKLDAAASDMDSDTKVGVGW